MIHRSLTVSNSMKLIRFFRIVSLFGAVLMVARALIFIAISGGILFLMK